MNERENNHLEDKEKIKNPIPETLDLVILDGRYAQCLTSGDNLDRHLVRFIDDGSHTVIEEEDWEKYIFEKPAKGLVIAADLVKQGLMTEDQLKQVHWGSEEETLPYLRGQVTFFGSYKRK